MSFSAPDPAAPRVRLPHLPALDGLRGLAVTAVLLFHGGVSQLRGGHLGVSVFFTLSGFLITALLLVERRQTGRVALGAFWARRARRLVPAMVLCLGVIALVLHLSDEALPRGVVGDAVAAMTWVANWRFIAERQTYADLFAMPTPFQHFWSLAVEEQFYLVFPLLFVLLCRPRGRARVTRLGLVLVALVGLSAVQAARLAAAGGGLGRAYYGTDARAAELLVGALLALLAVGPEGLRTPRRAVRWGLDVLGLAGLGVLGVALATVAKGDPFLYRGGFLAVAVASAAVIAAAVQPRSVVGRVLSLDPAVQLGRISYGVYLYHWPVFLLLTRHFTGYDGTALLALRIAVTLVVAWLSYVLFEHPIRFGHVPLRPGLVAWACSATTGVVLVALAAGVLVLPAPAPAPVVAAGPQALPGPTAGVTRSAAPQQRGRVAGRQQVAPQQGGYGTPQAAAPAPQPTKRQRRAAVPTELVAPASSYPVPPVPEAKPGQLKVAVVGDSVGFNIGKGFLAWAQERTDIVAYDLAIGGCPLSRGGARRIPPDIPFAIDRSCGWWNDPGSERSQALAQFDPDVIVMEDGINEVFDRKQPGWSDYRNPTEPQFDSWLTSELQAAERSWTGNGAKILLVNTPCADWFRYDHFAGMKDANLRVRALNLNVYDIASGVQRADLFNRICPNGQYSDTVEGIPNGRPDGFHFSPEAGAALVRNWLGPLAVRTAKSTVPLL